MAKKLRQAAQPQGEQPVIDDIAGVCPVEMNTTYVTNSTAPLNITTNIDNIVELDQFQIITYKEKADSDKFFCLNNEANANEKFYKPSAKSTRKSQAVDGAIYYDGKVWTSLRWSKDKDSLSGITNNTAPVFHCFADKGDKDKVWASYGDAFLARTFQRKDGVLETVKMEHPDFPGQTNDFTVVKNYNIGTEIYAEIVDKKVKSLKSLGDAKYTLKTYKDAAAREKAFEKLVKKFKKAGGKIR